MIIKSGGKKKKKRKATKLNRSRNKCRNPHSKGRSFARIEQKPNIGTLAFKIVDCNSTHSYTYTQAHAHAHAPTLIPMFMKKRRAHFWETISRAADKIARDKHDNARKLKWIWSILSSNSDCLYRATWIAFVWRLVMIKPRANPPPTVATSIRFYGWSQFQVKTLIKRWRA